MNTKDLFPETLLVSIKEGNAYTTSLKVAEHFGKQHKDVLRRIEKLIAELRSGSPFLANQTEFSRRNFAPSDYQNERGKTYYMYMLSHDGFALLAMGFTGKQALEWKVKFLAAFRAMERELDAMKERAATALYTLRPCWKDIVDHPDMRRADLIKLTGHKSPGSITACRRRMREVGLLKAGQ